VTAIDAYIGRPFVFQTVFLDPVTVAPLDVTGVRRDPDPHLIPPAYP
jgi:hypothetical protein